jgi:hypothetical protein
VNGLSSTLGSGSAIQATYDWDFGDSGSQYDQLVGFNAGHVYDNPGTYTITLSVTDANGQTSVATGTVNVQSNSSMTTIYVSPNGSDSNSGTSENSPIQSISQLNNMIASNERILFQDGGTYDLEISLGVNVGVSNVEIGSYGSGAQPILMYDGPAGVFGGIINIGGNNVSVQGLTFDSIYQNNQDEQAIYSGFELEGDNIVVRDNTFYNLLDDLDLSAGPSDVLVQNNSSPNPNDLSAYFAFVGGNNFEFLGNTVANSIGEAVFRTYANNILIADNNFTRLAVAGTGGKNALSIEGGNYTYVYGNTFSDGPVMAGPLGTPAADPNEQVNDVVFDSNVVINTTILLEPGVDQVMARNNLIETSTVGDAAFTVNAQEVGGGFDWQVQDVYIEHNTIVADGIYGGVITISDGEAQNIYLDYNLFVDPQFQTGYGEAFVKDNNNDLNSFAQIKDNVWSVPASVSGWAQGGYFWIGSDPSSESGWITPAQWEATGIPTGDVYENVTLGSTYAVTINGFSAGSTLPNS